MKPLPRYLATAALALLSVGVLFVLFLKLHDTIPCLVHGAFDGFTAHSVNWCLTEA